MIESSCLNLRDENSSTLLYCVLCIESQVGIELSIDSYSWGRSLLDEKYTRGNNASTRAVTRIFRAGRVFHANYSCYLCPACAERVRGLFAKTFQRDSNSSLLVALYRPASFLLSSPRLFVAPRLFLLLVLFLFSFFSFSFCVERHVSAARIAGTLCIASNILCDLIALALSRIFFFFFIFNSTLEKLY